MDNNNINEELSPITNISAAIEAILFAAGYPVKYEKLSEVLGPSVRELKAILSEMADSMNAENSPSGTNLLMFDDSCQLCTKERFAPYIREALGIRRGGNLSASSLEVLAVIVYNQPTTRAFVDAVRGVDSSYAVNSLIDKGLIESVGRLDAPGRPSLYGTTDKFLRVFGINSLDELPPAEQLVPPEQIPGVQQVADIETSGNTDTQNAADASAEEDKDE